MTRLVCAQLLTTAALLAACGGGDRATTETTPAGHFDFTAYFAQPLPRTLAAGSPARIDGVNVGTVTKVSRTPSAGAVAMRLCTQYPGSETVSLHRDAQVTVRARIFLEGDWFIDISPGTRAAPLLRNEATLPAAQTRVNRSRYG